MDNRQIAVRLRQITDTAWQRINGGSDTPRQAILEGVLQSLATLAGEITGTPVRPGRPGDRPAAGSRPPATRAEAAAAVGQVQQRGYRGQPAGQGHAVRPVRP